MSEINIYDVLLKNAEKKEVEVSPLDCLAKTLPKTVVKRVGEDETLCQHCGGFGVALDRGYIGAFVGSCQYCVGGVAKKCRHCQSQYGGFKNRLCQCEGAKKDEEERQAELQLAREARCAKKLESLEHITLEEFAKEGGEHVFVGEDDYVDLGTLEDFLRELEEEDPDFDRKLCAIHPAVPFVPKIDAESVLENALEEGPEGVHEYYSAESLQTVLNEWISKQGIGWYVPDESRIVTV